MEDRIDLMLDLETLRVGTDALIIQIACLPFDVNTGEIFKALTFDMSLDIENMDKLNGIDGRTLKWWLHPDRVELLNRLLNREPNKMDTFEEILKRFSKYIITIQDGYGKKNVYIWGNGSLFDNNKIQRQMENHGIEYPIHYRNDRDLRTIVDFAGAKSGYSRKEIIDEVAQNIENKGIEIEEHNAIDDCLFQIYVLQWCKKELVGESEYQLF